MQVIIDRIEGEFAVVELDDGSILDVPKSLFNGAKEGDIIDISINHQLTNERTKEIENLMDDIFID